MPRPGRRPVETFLDGMSFPEGPRWRDGALWVSDIHGHMIVRATRPGRAAPYVRLPDRPSGLGFLPDGRLVVSSILDRRLLAVGSDRAVETYADLTSFSRGFINDMVVDRNGRAYVGSRNGGAPATASDSLIRVDPDRTARTEVDGMTSPNGSVITPDGRELVIAETALGRLLRFRIGPDGSLSDRRIHAEFPGRHIDGICLDAAGGVWCGGGQGGLFRVGADGAITDDIPFPGRMIIACALGGADGRTLFLATVSERLLDNLAFVGNDRNRDADVESDGRIDMIRVDVPTAAHQ